MFANLMKTLERGWEHAYLIYPKRLVLSLVFFSISPAFVNSVLTICFLIRGIELRVRLALETPQRDWERSAPNRPVNRDK